MVALSIQAINDAAPYNVTAMCVDGDYRFVSDAGVVYSVGFDADDMIITSDESYQLLVNNRNNRKSPRDPKVRDTIIAIIEEFFDKNQSTLLYICDTGDSRQAARARLFGHWFAAYSKKHLYVTTSADIVDDDGIVNYTSIISRRDNPRLEAVMAEFAKTVTIFSHKPE